MNKILASNGGTTVLEPTSALIEHVSQQALKRDVDAFVATLHPLAFAEGVKAASTLDTALTLAPKRALSPELFAELTAATRAATSAAKANDHWSSWDYLWSILTLGVYAAVKAAETCNSEALEQVTQHIAKLLPHLRVHDGLDLEVEHRFDRISHAQALASYEKLTGFHAIWPSDADLKRSAQVLTALGFTGACSDVVLYWIDTSERKWVTHAWSADEINGAMLVAVANMMTTDKRPPIVGLSVDARDPAAVHRELLDAIDHDARLLLQTHPDKLAVIDKVTMTAAGPAISGARRYDVRCVTNDGDIIRFSYVLTEAKDGRSSGQWIGPLPPYERLVSTGFVETRPIETTLEVLAAYTAGVRRPLAGDAAVHVIADFSDTVPLSKSAAELVRGNNPYPIDLLGLDTHGQ